MTHIRTGATAPLDRRESRLRTVLAAPRHLLVLTVLALLGAGCTAVGAHETSIRLPPPSLIASDCAGQVSVIVASDEAAQSDIYSAVTLAGALDTQCLILAGPRDGDFPSDQLDRLRVAEGGYVLGGTAAVPDSKRFGRRRVAGADRWTTALAVGTEVERVATGEASLPETTEPVPSGDSGTTPADEISNGTYEQWIYEETAYGSINAVTGEFVTTGDFVNTSTALFVSCRRDPPSGPGVVGVSVYIRNATISRTANTIYWDLWPADISNGTAGEQNWSVGRPPTNMLVPSSPKTFAETLRDNPDNLLTFITATGNSTSTALFDTSGADTTIGALIGKCDKPH